MAGTLSGIALTANNDLNGIPLGGCKLYIYQAGGIVIQTPYADSGLTVAMSWPLLGDAYGRLPFFWLPDGNYRVRLTDANDVVIYDYASIPAVGASSSVGTSGSGVDTTALIQIGDVIWSPMSGSRAGFIRSNGRTIGSASSGASERANSDCQSLYTFLYSNFADAICPVSGGRGSSASSDWAANKPISTIDMKSAVLGGLDDMGGSVAGRFTNVPVITGSVTTGGSSIGSATTTLLTANLPPYTPGGLIGASQVLSNIFTGSAPDQAFMTGGSISIGGRNFTINGSSFTFAGTPQGGTSAPVNATQRTVLGTFFQKL